MGGENKDPRKGLGGDTGGCHQERPRRWVKVSTRLAGKKNSKIRQPERGVKKKGETGDYGGNSTKNSAKESS